jgi:hypothetical protein
VLTKRRNPFTRHGHEIEVGYGLTDFWKVEAGVTLQKPLDGEIDATNFEIENTLQLFTYQPLGAVFSVLASVDLGLADEVPDAFEFGPLVQFGNDQVNLVLNAIFEKTFGTFREPGMGFEYAAQLKYAVAEQVSLGVEAFGEIENIDDVPSFNETEFRIGPVIYFASADDDDNEGGKGEDDDEKGLSVNGGRETGMAFDVGVLLGVTDATPDVAVKWDLEISF